jgi:hypothetical protein
MRPAVLAKAHQQCKLAALAQEQQRTAPAQQLDHPTVLGEPCWQFKQNPAANNF